MTTSSILVLFFCVNSSLGVVAEKIIIWERLEYPQKYIKFYVNYFSSKKQ